MEALSKFDEERDLARSLSPLSHSTKLKTSHLEDSNKYSNLSQNFINPLIQKPNNPRDRSKTPQGSSLLRNASPMRSRNEFDNIIREKVQVR